MKKISIHVYQIVELSNKKKFFALREDAAEGLPNTYFTFENLILSAKKQKNDFFKNFGIKGNEAEFMVDFQPPHDIVCYNYVRIQVRCLPLTWWQKRKFCKRFYFEQ